VVLPLELLEQTPVDPEEDSQARPGARAVLAAVSAQRAPPDFDLFLFRDPRQWIEVVTALLLCDLNRHKLHPFDKIRAAG
jgi:hypothetical protein